jgi:hypothetical protein
MTPVRFLIGDRERERERREEVGKSEGEREEDSVKVRRLKTLCGNCE